MADDKTASHNIRNEVSSGTTVTNTIKGGVAGILIPNGDVINGKDAKIMGGESGIEVQGGGEKVKIENTGGDITGGKNGIKVNEGRGNVTVENTGGNITGSDYGIKVEGSGGGVTVDNTGTIEGKNADGIRLEGTGSTVNNKAGGTIKGGEVGISVVETATITNESGATIQGTKTGVRYEQYNTFTNDGKVEGTEEGGIAFGKGGELINNETGEVTGNTYAVYTGTYNDDPTSQTEKLIVTNSGTLSATGPNGIGLVIGNTESDITNKSRGKIKGTKYGVYVLENGKLKNEAGATIIGGTAGIKFEKSSTFTNSGKIGVIDEKTYVASGTNGIEFAKGGSFTNEATGSVVGIEDGVNSIGDTTVINKGTITGQTQSGVYIKGTGVVENQGKITGGEYGVLVRGDLILTNEGTIRGGTTGVEANGGDITNSGTIDGGSTGINILSSSTGNMEITNYGTITGETWYGINATHNGSTTITNSRTIEGAIRGININSGKVINKAGAKIKGGENGILVFKSATIENSGTIRGETQNGIYLDKNGTVNNRAGGLIWGDTSNGIWARGASTITNAAGATIHGQTTGVLYSQNNTFTNDGKIEGITGNGVEFQDGGTFTNNTTGEVTGGKYGVATTGGTITNDGIIKGGQNGIYTGWESTANLEIVNRGTISGQTWYGIEAAHKGEAQITNWKDIYGKVRGVDINNGKVINKAGAKITGDENGIRVYKGANIENYGTISGGTQNGIYLDENGTVINRAGGLIEGKTYNGIWARGTSTITNAAGATIRGQITGLLYSQYNTFTNDGKVEGVTGNGIEFQNGGEFTNNATGEVTGGKYGVATTGGKITNYGNIEGGDAGVAMGGGTLLNNNLISSKGTGVLAGAATVDNNGTITGDETGVSISGGTLTNDNIIFGGITGVLSSGGNDTNNSMISGGETGVVVIGAATFDNYGTIGEIVQDGEVTQTALNGVEIYNANATVTNKGWVTKEGKVKGGTIKGKKYGVHLKNNSTLTNEKGATVSGGVNGIEIEYGNVKNYGDIQGGTGSAIHVASGGYGKLYNYTGGKVTGGTSGSAVQVDKDAYVYVENQEGAEIKAEGKAIDLLDGGKGDIKNSGEIEGTGTEGTGIHVGKATDADGNLVLSAVVTNEVKGTISGGKDGMLIDGLGVIYNYGEMNGGTGSTIHVAGGGHGELVNYAGGKVTGGTSGAAVQVDKDAYAYIENHEKGEIKGETAIDIKDGGSGDVVNIGTIEGTGTEGTGIHVGKTTDANGNLVLSATIRNGTTGTINGSKDGMLIDGLGLIFNDGEMNGGTGSAIHVAGGGHGELVNYAGGKVTGGTSGSAVQVDKDGYAYILNRENAEIKGSESVIDVKGASDIENSGTIQQESKSGAGAPSSISDSRIIEIDGTVRAAIGGNNAGTVTILNKTLGTIKGESGIFLTGTGNDTLDNYGTIIGTGGTAVNMGGGNDTVIMRSGSRVTGNMDGGAGTDSILFEGSGEVVGGTALEFENITKTGSGTWTVNDDLHSGKNISIYGGRTSILKVNGDYTQDADSIFIVEFVDGYTGKIHATTAHLNGGLVVALGYIREGVHTILETDKGVTGTFTGLGEPGVEHKLGRYISYVLLYDDKNAAISYFWRSRHFAEDAMTRNEKAVAYYLDGIYNNLTGDLANNVFRELIKMDDPVLFRSALNQMGGASHTAFVTVDKDRQSHYYRSLLRREADLPFKTTADEKLQSFLGQTATTDVDQISSALAAAAAPLAHIAGGMGLPWSVWGKSYATKGERRGDDIASRYDYWMGGALFGMDYRPLPELRLGVSIGYSKTDMTMKDLQDNGQEDSFQSSLYASYTQDRWYVDVALTQARNNYTMSRSIDFGEISRTAESSYDGYEFSGYAEAGYRLQSRGFQIMPVVSCQALRHHRNGFRESGADSLNLISEGEDTESLQTSLGVKISKTFNAGDRLTLTPEFSARWIYEFGDPEALLNARFTGASAGSFTVYSDNARRSSAAATLGVTGDMGKSLGFFLHYDVELRERQASHAASGGLRYSW